eukprot:COSAG01_NODE_28_length_36622_cov_14.695751_28_plen_155_part_00
MIYTIRWTTDIGGYKGGNPEDPTWRELIVRWFQFGAFCPLFRLHGSRGGAKPPANQCGGTGGTNEVWHFGEEAMKIIPGVMRLRETLREYVDIHMNISSATGMPLLRPMVLQFPNDPKCADVEVEDQCVCLTVLFVTTVPRSRLMLATVWHNSC